LQKERRALWHLKRVTLLKELSSDEFSTLAAEAEMEEFRRRRVIYMPGDPGETVYIVNTGRVKISRVTPDGKELTLAYRGPGELFGELCLIDGGPREEMSEAVDNTLLTQLPRQSVDRIMSKHLAVGYAMSRMLLETRRVLERKIEDLVFKDVNSKLAELLLKLAKSHGVEDERGTLVAMKMTHQEMANLIGSTRETVSLTLSQFKRKKLISTDARKVIITDPEGLKALL
jgi:CRP/FNR family cyclic AMP-dependent transcriptional regulator